MRRTADRIISIGWMPWTALLGRTTTVVTAPDVLVGRVSRHFALVLRDAQERLAAREGCDLAGRRALAPRQRTIVLQPVPLDALAPAGCYSTAYDFVVVVVGRRLWRCENIKHEI